MYVDRHERRREPPVVIDCRILWEREKVYPIFWPLMWWITFWREVVELGKGKGKPTKKGGKGC
jgi:hypothetical protein